MVGAGRVDYAVGVDDELQIGDGAAALNRLPMQIERRARRGPGHSRRVGVVQGHFARARIVGKVHQRVGGAVADGQRIVDQDIAGVEGARFQLEGIRIYLERRIGAENDPVDREVGVWFRVPPPDTVVV